MKKIYTIVALLTLCFCVATGLTGCKKTPGEELNNKPLNEVIKINNIPGTVEEDETEKLEDILNKIQSSEGYTGDFQTLTCQAQEDITIKSLSLTASFNFDSEAWIEIRKYKSDTLLESKKTTVSKNTFYNFSTTSEEGVTFKKGSKFHIHVNQTNLVDYPLSSNTPTTNTLKNLKIVFM